MKDKIEKLILSILIIMQPLMDLYIFNMDKYQVFGINLSTAIRLASFFVLVILTILKFKKLKYKWAIITYSLILAIYFILHHLFITDFNVMTGVTYSFKEELFYYIRMIIPIYLLYITYNSSYKLKDLKISIYLLCIIMGSMLLISNFTKTSLATYSDHQIACNVLDWFKQNENCTYLYSASRGFFNTMIITYLLLLSIPLVVYDFINGTKYNILKVILIVVNMLCCFMVGTKVTTYGCLILLTVSILLALYYTFVSKKKSHNLIKIAMLSFILAGFIMIIPYSPSNSRKIVDNVSYDKQKDILAEVSDSKIKVKDIKKYVKKDKINITADEITIEEVLELVDDETEKEKILSDYLSKYYYAYGFSQYLIEKSYPYTVDPFFWKNLIDNMPLYERSNNRIVVEKILKRVIELNGNKVKYKLFGIGYSRTSHIYNLERDIKYQYYSMGILGTTVLFFPYIGTIIFVLIMIIKKATDYSLYKSASIILGIGFIICVAYYSGNTLENLGIVMPLGIICGYIVKREEGNHERSN